MKLNKTAIILCILILFSSAAFADSPLTSTDFSDAYADEPIVIAASKTTGYITNQLMDYLTDEKRPIALKMAVINKFGWNINGKNNDQVFMKYLKEKYGYSDEKAFLEKGKGDELLSMAYLKALSNYFEVDNAVKYAEKALEKNPKSRTYNLIVGLIKAQKAMDSDWCEVFQITDRVRKDTNLINDMKPEAVKIIYDYMDIYGDDCK